MPARAVITTPYPSVAETAKEVCVGKKRVRELARLMQAVAAGRIGKGRARRPKARLKTKASSIG